MKKFFIFCMLFLLCGCGGTKPSVPSPSPAEEEAVLIGTFITDILDTDPARVGNLTLCAETISGARIMPGDIFSFNTATGERTAEKGYKEARILVEGHGETATGGGVCQISSTLYNAAEDAGMEILERHTHTNEVHYVSLGRDAAVSFGTQDFRFRNTLDIPVTIEVLVENAQVKASIYKIVTKM